MTSNTRDAPLSEGSAALASGDWERALRLLEPVVEQAPTGAALEALGTACFWLDRSGFGALNWERLVAVKREIDPDNVFRHNHNIAPA